jgi:hypothetical protein
MGYVQNIIDTYKKAQAHEIADGVNWYRDAQEWAQGVADRFEIPLRIVVGVCAALSPTNRWERNKVDAEHMLETFVSGGYVEDCAPCTYKTMRDKAWRILEEMPTDDQHVCAILRGPKITDFFLCIIGHDVCVVDGHAWCIANADRRTMQEVPNIGKKLRREIQDAYAVAGHVFNKTAYEMQAITWVAWKRIHNV